jgi:sRNA-binding protein
MTNSTENPLALEAAAVVPDTVEHAADPASPKEAGPRLGRRTAVLPVLEKLFELYPQLFGAEFLPLKLGIFQELLAGHPDQLERASLKAALGVHTRSTAYLQSVAAGKARHDLQGLPVEAVAPEHVYLALLELFRRRQGRSAQDLRPKLRKQLLTAFEASGLSRQDYQTRMHGSDEDANTLLAEAFSDYDQERARQEALRRAFEASGKAVGEFAAMYGMDPRDVERALERKV